MEIHGQVVNGVVVLDEGSPRLPEGTRVSVVPGPQILPVPPVEDRPRLDFPLIRGGEPGTLHLTNALIEAICEEEDLEQLRRSGFDVRS